MCLHCASLPRDAAYFHGLRPGDLGDGAKKCWVTRDHSQETHALAHTPTHTDTHTHRHTHTHTHTHTHLNTNTHTHIHTDFHTHKCTHISKYMITHTRSIYFYSYFSVNWRTMSCKAQRCREEK